MRVKPTISATVDQMRTLIDGKELEMQFAELIDIDVGTTFWMEVPGTHARVEVVVLGIETITSRTLSGIPLEPHMSPRLILRALITGPM